MKRLLVWVLFSGPLALCACKKDEPAPAAVPAPAPAAVSATRTLDHKLGDTMLLSSLREGDVLRYPTFSLTYRGLRSKPGEPALLARHFFATTNKSGKQVELGVVQGTTAAMQIGGALYRIDTRGGNLKVSGF